MVLALIYNEEDPVQIRLHRSAIRSVDDINESVKNLFPNPPIIEIFNLTYKEDLKHDDSLFLEKFEDLVRGHGVKMFFGLSSNAQDIRTLAYTGKKKDDEQDITLKTIKN